jgi:hypothetical protein
VQEAQLSRCDPAVLAFRRQFVLGPSFVEQFPHWKRVTIGTLRATIHPDLDTAQVASGEKSVTLLGFVLNPGKPQATNHEVVTALLSELHRNDDLDVFVESTYHFGGRWILIADNGREVRLFHDAAGLRQVFYTDRPAAQANWCASDPGVIAAILGLAADGEAQSFIASYEQANKEYWWPGDTSPYAAVRRLLPNHHLDLRTRACRRYWPRTDVNECAVSDCVQWSAEFLPKMMESAHHRFPLALTVTAGWDSRLALAATRSISRDVLYFTLMYWELSEDSDDILIPARLLPACGLRHHVITCPSTMESEFAKLYRSNVTTAHEVYGTIAQGLFNEFPQDRVMVKAVVSEVARCWYRQRVPPAANGTVTPGMLAHALEMEADPFVLAAYDRWLAGIGGSCNIDVFDLLFWEQRMGSWQAAAQLEWDIVQDVFTPFNCRALLTHFLSVDRKYREPRHPVLYAELITRLWPELLNEPINPSKNRKSLRAMLGQFVSDSPVRQFVPQQIRRLGRRFLYPERRFSREG